MEDINKMGIKNTKKKPPVFILFLLIFIIIVFYLIYSIGLNFKPVAIIQYDGYAVAGKELVENLLRSDLNAKKYINAVKIEEDSAIYKKIASYFVGEEKKTKINLDYPIYINQNIALLNMNEDSTLITTDLESVKGYKNSTLTNGCLYNVDGFERADFNDYLFLKSSDNVFMNSKEIEIKTNTNTYVIPTNSIISFTEDYIAYYRLENGIFIYKAIVDVQESSIVTLELKEYTRNAEKEEMTSNSIQKQYSYKEFLKNLNLIKDPIIKRVEEPKTEEPQEPEVPVEEPKTEEPKKEEIKWIKPEVKATDFVSGVYTADTTLSIYDPSGAIKTAIVFEIYKDGKIYMRNQAVTSGNIRLGIIEPDTEYQIRGIYRYSDKDSKTIESEFINQKIKTKDTSGLKPISLSFENGKKYSNKIEIKNLKVSSNLNEVLETLIGVKTAIIKIDQKEYTISSTMLRRMLNGQEVTIESKGNLKSNSEISFEINFYDVANNKVKLQNNIGKTHTCMKEPSAKVERIDRNSGTDVEIRAKIINTDKVKLNNLHYVVYSVNNEVIDSGVIVDEKIKPKNIELSKYYNIKVYADYDLKDDNGERKDVVLGETAFTTESLDSFGDLYIDSSIHTEDVDKSSAIINLSVNTTQNKTNIELLKMIKKISIKIYNGKELFREENISNEDLQKIVNLENLSLSINNLYSNTEYEIVIKATIELGNSRKELTAIINGPKKFTTLKEEAQLNIRNLFILKNIIDFDINIYDKDNAIRDGSALLEIIDTRDQVLLSQEIVTSNKAYENTRVQIKDLEEGEKYYITLTADKYSTRQEESTLKSISFSFDGDEKRLSNEKRDGKNIGIIWTNHVGGDISLDSIKREAITNNKNLIDVESNVNWYSECFNTTKGYLKEYNESTKILKLGVGNSTSQIYIYDLKSALPNYNKDEIEISFKYKKSASSLNVYLQKGKNFNNDKVLQINANNSSLTSDNWLEFNSSTIIESLKTEQYIGLLLEGSKNSYIEIKELQVKLKNTESDPNEQEYTEFKCSYISNFNMNLNLYDESLLNIGYNANITNGIYYIKIENITDNKSDYKKYSNYKEIAKNDKGKNNNEIENYILNLDLERNKEYKIHLILKNSELLEREYILNTIQVNTNVKEIKSISNINDYLQIQPNGNYIFTNNIDLNSGDYKFGNNNLYFNGELDVNGKTIKRKIELKQDSNYKYYLFYGFSETANIRNIYFDFSIDLWNAEGSTNVAISEQNSGLVYDNKGNINNIIVKLASSTVSPNRKFAILGYTNSGTLENFVIYLRSSFYLNGTGALGFVNCSNGIIKNGYVTPYPNTNHSIRISDCTEASIDIGALVANVSNNSLIENIYSLVNINTREGYINPNIEIGNIIGELKNSTTKNIYSVGIGTSSKTNLITLNAGPNIGNQYKIENNNNVERSYFFINENLNNNEYNAKVNIAALSNQEFQENLLNSEGENGQFIINSTIKSYFPQIKLSYVMPAQLKIPMKKALETDADILLVEVLKEGDLEKIVEFTIFNPMEAKIDKIGIEGLEVDKYRIHSDKYCEKDSSFEKCVGGDSEGYCLDKNGNRIKVAEDGYTQNYLSGQTTKLIAKVKIPTNKTIDNKGFDSRTYASVYNMESIRAMGYVEKQYIDKTTGQKIKNELKLTYYYPITSIDDWRRINEYSDENYRIMSDLNFANYEYTNYCVSNKFSGILDGQNTSGKVSKISNIGSDGIEIKQPLFRELNNATFRNILINGFTQQIENKDIKEKAYLTGIIGTTTKGTTIENIHANNVKITIKAENNNTDLFYIGGLASIIDTTVITDSSISYYNDANPTSNIKEISNNRLSAAYVGGLVAYSKAGKISNCYVRNLYVDLKAAVSNGFGGLVGQYQNGNIKNCYATGQIKSNTQNIGGIFGISRYQSDNACTNCYAAVNIKTDGSNIGGIGGFSDSGAISKIVNNVSIGNIYTSISGSNTNLNRIIGNVSSTSYVNYAYKDQLINGFKISAQDKNYNKGAKYVVERKNFAKNYNNMFNVDFYNVSDLNNLCLPRLKYKGSNVLLPNQVEAEILPDNPTLEILSATEEKGQIKITIKDENIVPLSTNYINVEIANFSGINVENREFNTNTKIHTLYITGAPIYYLDSYEICKLMYRSNNGEDYSAEVAVKVDYLQYKEINSTEEWAREFCPDYSKYNYHKTENDGKPEFITNQNYKLTGDVNLTEIQTLNGETLKVPLKLEIGRLVGNQENPPTISNLSTTTNSAYSGIFSTISKELKNINFKDIEIKNTIGNFVGIISRCTAQSIENLSFTNIKLESVGDNVAPIGDSTCTNIKNIKLENIQCKGYHYVAGFIARTYPGTIKNIQANNVKIDARYSYAGGIFGYVYLYAASYGNNITDIKITNSSISSAEGDYVAGIVRLWNV